MTDYRGKVRGIYVRGPHYWGRATAPGRTAPVRMPLEKWAALAGLAQYIPVATDRTAEAVYTDFRSAVLTGRYADIVASRRPGQHDALTVAAFLDDYLALHAQANKVGSVAADLGVLRAHFGGCLLRDITTPAAILKYKQAMIARKLAPATINRRLARAKHMLRWAVAMGYVREQTAFPVTTAKGAKPVNFETVDNQRERRVTPTEEQALRNQIDDSVMEGRFLFALYAGARRGEMQLVQRKDVDYTKWEVTLRGSNTKSGKTRRVPIEFDELRRFLNTRRFLGQDDYVFGTVAGEYVADFKRQWHAIVLRAHGHHAERSATNGISEASMAIYQQIDLNWHDLRHEYATRLVEAGESLERVQKLLGHASILTTQRYNNLAFEKLRESVRRAHGGGK